jgi:hypothetical protein
MRNRIKYKKLFFLSIVIFFLVYVPQYSSDLKDRPDSIMYIMGINIDDSTLEELPGNDIIEFRIYTTAKKSSIVWKFQNEYFIFTLDSSDHILKAAELFKQLKKNGITTFVAKRNGKTIRLNKYRTVLAVQIVANKN